MVLTLPMAGMIKKRYPGCKIYFLGRSYTKEIIGLSKFVDDFINYDELEKMEPAQRVKAVKEFRADVFIHVFPKKEIAALAKEAAIPLRVGTTSRLYHWFTCNKLLRLSRKNSELHEAQLNAKLLSFLDIDVNVPLDGIKNFYGFTQLPELEARYAKLIDKTKKNIILHPKSKGSAKEWGLENFKKLITLLPKENYSIFISGTQQDKEQMRGFLESVSTEVTDITGQMSLQQFIAFINACDGLVAASTGPLHISAALNKRAVGLFSARRPIFPQRWKPLGEKAVALVEDCKNCEADKSCDCISRIAPEKVADVL